ncbi:hypothetical protein MTO96_044463 [Rhipicephalus appendiculatus]
MSLFPFDFLKAHTDISTPVALLGFREDPAMLGSSLRNVSLPVSLWNCVERSRCFADLTYYVAQVGVGFPRLGFILVPFLERSLDHIPNKDMAMFEKYHSNVHWIFSVRKHDDVLEHFSGHLCQVVTVTEAQINAPWNSYNSCEVRKLYTAADDPQIVDRIPSPGTYPKHGRVTFAAHDDKSIGCFKPHGPVGERLVEVYLGLNNTLVETCNCGETDSLLLEKRADFIITATNFAPSTSYYQHAVHQHRRFMLAMEESGLTMQSLRPLLPWISNTSGPVPFDMPLTDYAAVYVTGCCLSLLAFFAELLFARRAVHKAPSFRDQISATIDRPLARSEDTPSDCSSTP